MSIVDPNRTVTIGTRVYYKERPQFKGTIVNITLEEYAFTVKWDDNDPDEGVDSAFHT